MDHGLTLISTLATAFGAALILGFIAARLRLPALVGYLSATKPGVKGPINTPANR